MKSLRIGLAGRLLVTLPYMALVAVLSVTPDAPNPGDSMFVWLVHTTPSPLQKFLHVCAYAALAACWGWVLTPLVSLAKGLITAFGVAVAFGILLEWCQTFVPGRFGSIYDVMLNGTGAFLGTLAVYAWLAASHEPSSPESR